MDKLIEHFCAVTGVQDAEQAKNLLEVCAGNLEMAIDMHMESTQAATSNSNVDDEVRAPIPQKREQLMVHDQYLFQNKRRRPANPNSVFDKFRDFQAEARQQEQILRGESSSSTSSSNSSHLTKLEDLFRPPLDLIHHGTLASAQAKGKLENKWILVNIQNTSEFSCQVLNRDIWKDASIRTLLAKNFIFWQVYHDSVEGQKYAQFYPIKRWPYIAILHPVTAELKQYWNDVVLKDFLQELREFMVLYSLPEGRTPSPEVSPEKKPLVKTDPLLEASEESQIQAAIRASMNDSKSQNELKFESDSDDECYSDVIQSDEEDGDNRSHSSPEKSTDSEPKIASNNSANNSAKKQDDNLVNSFNDVDNHSWRKDSWQKYASDEGSDVRIQFRLPDQTRHQWATKTKSKLKALLLYVNSLGYKSDAYEVIANFPRRLISQLDPDMTLEAVGFAKQETLYIQEV